MKPPFLLNRIPFVICVILFSLHNLMSQEFCDGVTGTGSARSNFGCPDLDELTAEEVQAMPIMYIPVVFHFIAYRDTLAHENVNFVCNRPSHLDSINPNLYAPEFVYHVMKEMNDRMADQLLESPTGESSALLDTRIRYYLHDGPDWMTLSDHPDCSSFNFYDVGVIKVDNFDSLHTFFNSLPKNAVHIVCLDNKSKYLIAPSPSNPTPVGGEANQPHVIQLKNYARAYFRKPSFIDNWSPGRTNNHEIGHLFDLDHTFNCNNICRKSTLYPDNPIDPAFHCCDTCYAGNGNPPIGFPVSCVSGACFNPSQGGFLMNQGYLTVTLCEHRVWWSAKSSSNPYSFVDFCNDSSRVDTLIYDTGTKLTWSGQRLINADVIIKNGTEIEITCDIFMGKDKKIIVERGARLTVNGGSISGLCENEWQGIIVEGVSDSLLLAALGNDGQLDNYDDALDPDKAGTVVLLNSSISEAKTGISTYNNQYSWPALKGYYGGLIYCDNAHFFDCNRAVEFMKYGQDSIKDASQFVNCKFEDLDRGVTLWANNGVEFYSSEFNNCGKEGILSYDSQIIVEDSCKFYGNLNAIELFSTYPNPFGHRIGSLTSSKNVFYNNHYGIYGNNQGSIKRLIIENNNFDDNDFGIGLYGLSHFIINSNNFSDSYISQEIAACGDNENMITTNYIEDNSIPTNYIYKNEGSSFLHNCYVSSTNFDVLLNHSNIFPLMGSASSSAGNCFTKGSIPSIYCNSNASAVKYYAYGTSTSCYYPIISNCSNVSREAANSVISLDCAHGPIPLSGPGGECAIPSTDVAILSGIIGFDASISSTQASSTYTTQQKIELIAGYRKCQSTLIYKFIEHGLANSSVPLYQMIDSLATYLNARPEFKYKIHAYGLKVYSGQYADAANYLTRLTTSNEEEADFVTVQKINLDYLQDIANYTPRTSLLDTLYDIGMKTHPYTGYARSLYHLLTGELIQFDIPDIDGIVLPRAIVPDERIIKSYPNPIQEKTYNIEFKGFKDLGLVNIQVFDMFGKEITTKVENILNDSTVQLNTQDWPFTMYVLTVKSKSGELLYSTKFNKVK
ncbi:MAG TPA: T9SS type A sorting domain-containing protein [Saprospiraceae bacterium]|nr:T9SS type A sorting domain-containing protein [Saprospiraceae bacterium]